MLQMDSKLVSPPSLSLSSAQYLILQLLVSLASPTGAAECTGGGCSGPAGAPQLREGRQEHGPRPQVRTSSVVGVQLCWLVVAVVTVRQPVVVGNVPCWLV